MDHPDPAVARHANRFEGAATLIGESRAMSRVTEFIGRVAKGDSTVLIRGESGTGKELVARAIHAHSLRPKKKP